FKHRGYWLGNQTPKSPSIYRIRSDKSWSDVVHSFHHRSHKPSRSSFPFLFSFSLFSFIHHIIYIRYSVPDLQSSSRTRYKSMGWWKNTSNRRQFLIDLATSKGLDPFSADTWTTKILRRDIVNAKV